uniref:Uncharacterized protein n=1 Tax=Capra hircus TaxID=9925 RepID=A0A8C2S3I8_CAPHI
MAAESTANPSQLLPPKLVDKCAASRIHIVMKSDRETVDTLQGFDGFGIFVKKKEKEAERR